MAAVSVPSNCPVEWRARIGDGAWFRWPQNRLLAVFATEARLEAARRFGNLDPQNVVVERVGSKWESVT